jgi:hypothetical protein
VRLQLDHAHTNRHSPSPPPPTRLQRSSRMDLGRCLQVGRWTGGERCGGGQGRWRWFRTNPWPVCDGRWADRRWWRTKGLRDSAPHAGSCARQAPSASYEVSLGLSARGACSLCACSASSCGMEPSSFSQRARAASQLPSARYADNHAESRGCKKRFSTMTRR